MYIDFFNRKICDLMSDPVYGERHALHANHPIYYRNTKNELIGLWRKYTVVFSA